MPKFFPLFQKRLHVISDGLKEYSEWRNEDNSIVIDVTYQMDMPYPLLPLTKTYFIENLLPNDSKYTFYFDADTIFLDKNEQFWQNLYENINRNEILISFQPKMIKTNDVVSKLSNAKIPTENYYPVISSFFGGKTDKIIELCRQMNNCVSNDLTFQINKQQFHYIPPLFDQDYMNKIVYDSCNLSFLIKKYILISWFEEEYSDDIFIEQKYDISKKFDKKKIKNYKDNVL